MTTAAACRKPARELSFSSAGVEPRVHVMLLFDADVVLDRNGSVALPPCGAPGALVHVIVATPEARSGMGEARAQAFAALTAKLAADGVTLSAEQVCDLKGDGRKRGLHLIPTL